MDAKRFDALARDVWQRATRRRILLRLAVLPVLGVVAAHFAGAEESSAAHPAHRLQDRKARKHDHARRRKKHRRDVRRRGNGNQGGGGGGVGGGGGETCVPIDQVCSGFSRIKCCEPAHCYSTASVFITTCQLYCNTTAECQQKLQTDTVECVEDQAACPGTAGTKCCRPKKCTNSGDCCDLCSCCNTLVPSVARCCAKGQHCAPGGGCATD